MAIYLGSSGSIELQRESLDVRLESRFDPDDVNVSRRRFSFDFPPTSLITGDFLEIGTVDGSDLQLVAGHPYPDGKWYVHIDEAGGVRLYDRFEDCLDGGYEKAVELAVPTTVQDIYAIPEDTVFRCVAQVQRYELTTTRETLDITNLGEEFRRQYANGMISGQGQLSCFWDYKHDNCDPRVSALHELPHYLAKLVLRTQLGASFIGRFYMHKPDPGQGEDTFVWWEARCIVNNCSMGFTPGEPVISTIDFVTSGQFELKMGQPPSYLLQEDFSRILQDSREGGDGILLDSD